MRSTTELEALNPTNIALERCRRQLQFLEDVVRATAAGTPRDELLHTIVDRATTATACDVCSVYLWSPEDRALVLRATNGLPRRYIGQVKIALGEGVTGWVGAQRTALAVRDVRYDARFNWVAGFDQPRYISMLSVPILSNARLVGVINVQTADAHQFSDEETELLGALAAEIANVVELAQLHDTLTSQLTQERRAAARLLDLSGDRDQMLGAVLSEFRSPLRIVKARLNTLTRLVAPEERHLLSSIGEQLGAMEATVDGLLTVLAELPRAGGVGSADRHELESPPFGEE